MLGETRVVEHYFNEDLTVIATRANAGISESRFVLRVEDRFAINLGKFRAEENRYNPRPVVDT